MFSPCVSRTFCQSRCPNICPDACPMPHHHTGMASYNGCCHKLTEASLLVHFALNEYPNMTGSELIDLAGFVTELWQVL